MNDRFGARLQNDHFHAVCARFSAKCLCQILQDVIDMLRPNRQSEPVLGLLPMGPQLFRAHLRMSRARGVDDE